MFAASLGGETLLVIESPSLDLKYKTFFGRMEFSKNNLIF